ncbi:unnamed protein product, partial [Trichogramma brassicae]
YCAFVRSQQVMPLEHVLQDEDYPETVRLLKCQNIKLSLIADRKGDESLQAYKFNEDKTLNWLKKKVEKVAIICRQKGIHVSQGAISANYVKSSKYEGGTDTETFKTFLQEYAKIDDKEGNKVFPYRQQLTNIAHREQVSLIIDLDDLKEVDEELAEYVRTNTRRYVNLLLELVQEILPDFKEHPVQPKDALDIYIEHRLMMQARAQNEGEQRNPQNQYAPELMRRFEVYFKNTNDAKSLSVRDIKAQNIGQLVTVRGIVTRCTEVKPLLVVATYTCDQCGAETYQTVPALTYMPLQTCPSDDCRINKSGGRLYQQTKGSKFIKFQEIKIQEHSDQVPTGHIPRSLSVYCRGEMTRKCQPGDHIVVTGIFLPIVRTGFSEREAAGLLSDTYLDAHLIDNLNSVETDNTTNELSEEELDQLTRDDFYSKLASSIAPEIYGHEDIKKVLLLLLVGGTEQKKGDIKIRASSQEDNQHEKLRLTQSKLRSGIGTEFPMQVSVQANGQHKCAGTLITIRHVLTSAYCVYSQFSSPTPILEVRTALMHAQYAQLIKIKRVVRHSAYQYTQGRTLGRNDIAIITRSLCIYVYTAYTQTHRRARIYRPACRTIRGKMTSSARLVVLLLLSVLLVSEPVLGRPQHNYDAAANGHEEDAQCLVLRRFFDNYDGRAENRSSSIPRVPLAPSSHQNSSKSRYRGAWHARFLAPKGYAHLKTSFPLPADPPKRRGLKFRSFSPRAERRLLFRVSNESDPTSQNELLCRKIFNTSMARSGVDTSRRVCSVGDAVVPWPLRFATRPRRLQRPNAANTPRLYPHRYQPLMSRLTARVSICGGRCCDHETEEHLRQQAKDDFYDQIHHHSRSLLGLLATTADALRAWERY